MRTDQPKVNTDNSNIFYADTYPKSAFPCCRSVRGCHGLLSKADIYFCDEQRVSDWALLAPQSGAARAPLVVSVQVSKALVQGTMSVEVKRGDHGALCPGPRHSRKGWLSSYGVLVTVHISPRLGLWTSLNRSESMPHLSASERGTKRATEEPSVILRKAWHLAICISQRFLCVVYKGTEMCQ